MGRGSSRRNRRLGILIGVTVGLVTLAAGETDASVDTTTTTQDADASE